MIMCLLTPDYWSSMAYFSLAVIFGAWDQQIGSASAISLLGFGLLSTKYDTQSLLCLNVLIFGMILTPILDNYDKNPIEFQLSKKPRIRI